MDGVRRQVGTAYNFPLDLLYNTLYTIEPGLHHYNVRIPLFRSTFVTIGNVLITMNYAKNFYLYCLVHEDIRKIAVSKLSFLVRKLKLC